MPTRSSVSAKNAGIPPQDIQTTSYRIQVVRDTGPKAKPAIVRGYEVSNTVTVTVRDLDRLPAVLDAAAAAGANQVQGPISSFSTPRRRKTRRAAWPWPAPAGGQRSWL